MAGDCLGQVAWVVRKVVPVDKGIAEVVEVHSTRGAKRGHCCQFMTDFYGEIEIIRIAGVLVESLEHNHQCAETGWILIKLISRFRY